MVLHDPGRIRARAIAEEGLPKLQWRTTSLRLIRVYACASEQYRKVFGTLTFLGE